MSSSSTMMGGATLSPLPTGAGDGTPLTKNGVRALRAGVAQGQQSVVLQVLGLYRYIADPALIRELPPDIAAGVARDVFDVLLSDGQTKIKCLLAPALNACIWQNGLVELDVVEISACSIVTVVDGNDASAPHRSVCVIRQLTAHSRAIKRKIVSSRLSSAARPTSASFEANLRFFSTTHAREHAEVPLLGARLYYLSLGSDDCPFGWQTTRSERLSPATLIEPWLAWNQQRHSSFSIFYEKDGMLHTIEEANAMTRKRPRYSDSAVPPMLVKSRPNPTDTALSPPIIGVVQFKSRITHMGVANRANPFPFMFHMVISDRKHSLEVAFFGSMAAKYFLTLDEGDVVHLKGYTIVRSKAPHLGDKPQKLFIFPHLSPHGAVSIVPDKYWKLLDKAAMLPKATARRIEMPLLRDDSSHQYMNPTFFTTLDIQRWEVQAEDPTAGVSYFDFVGVVSFVGGVTRERRRSTTHVFVDEVRSTRWIKVIDDSCACELVVLVSVTSQPAVFHSLTAGDLIMLTRLTWVDGRDGEAQEPGIEYAQTSTYSVLRRNETVYPLRALEAVSLAMAFATALMPLVQIERMTIKEGESVDNSESWLEGEGVAHNEPVYTFPLSEEVLCEHAKSVNVSDVKPMCDSMEMYERRHVLLRGTLQSIRAKPRDRTYAVDVMIGDEHRSPSSVVCACIRPNPLFRTPILPTALSDMASLEANRLLQLLPAQVVDKMSAELFPRRLRGTRMHQEGEETKENHPTVSLSFVEDYVKTHVGQDFTFSCRLYRTSRGNVRVTVDTIL